jgi:hypothetical protein
MKVLSHFSALMFSLMFILALSACKKEEDPPEEFHSLSFEQEEVLDRIPSGLKSSNDIYAQSCYHMVETVVDMSEFIDNMDVPEDATRDRSQSDEYTWKWDWHSSSGIATLYWNYEERESRRYWSLDVQFNDGQRYNYIDAWESLDGLHGEVAYNVLWYTYGEDGGNTDSQFLRYTWDQDASGTFTFNWKMDDAAGGSSSPMHYMMVINADGSGLIKHFSYDELETEMSWDALGNGSWVFYAFGEAYADGSWTV